MESNSKHATNPPTASWSFLSFNLLQVTKKRLSSLSLLFNTLQRSWLASFLQMVPLLKRHKSLASSSVGFTLCFHVLAAADPQRAPCNGLKMSLENRDEELRNPSRRAEDKWLLGNAFLVGLGLRLNPVLKAASGRQREAVHSTSTSRATTSRNSATNLNVHEPRNQH